VASFGDMLSIVRLQVQREMDDNDLKICINNAQRQIVESFDWTYNETNVVINSRAPKQTGLITVSQGSAQVLGDAGCAFDKNDVGSFLWVGGLNIAPCPVIDVQGARMLTLGQVWPAATVTLSGYILAPLYYILPGVDECLDIRGIDPLEKFTRAQLNARDPARVAQGGAPSTAWAPAPWAADGSLQVELWPVPADARWYLADVRLKAPKLVQLTDQPLCPSNVLEPKALMNACLSIYASTGNAQWNELATKYEAHYLREWEDAQIKDKDRRRNLITTAAPRSVPMLWDAQFDSSHDLSYPRV
jgi:hypothetical protein